MKEGNVLKYISGILLTLCFVVIPAKAIASEREPFIRYDRVWENISMRPYDVIKSMKFDGTEEINGKTWHRIVTFRKADVGAYDYELGKFKFTIDYNVYENEGYMREEDGIIYTLLYRFINDEFDKSWDGVLYLDSTEEIECYQYYIAEGVVYNFNCEEGDTYDGISFFETGLDCFDETNLDGTTTFQCISTSNVEIDGKECKKMQVRAIAPFPYLTEYPIIEGIGAIDYGCLNYLEFTAHATHMWYHKCFLRLLDLDDNVIFSNDDAYNVPYGGTGAVSELTEGSRMLVADGLVSFGEDNHRNSVTLYDLGGKEAVHTEGTGRVYLATDCLASGVYVAVASTDGNIVERRKVMIK